MEVKVQFMCFSFSYAAENAPYFFTMPSNVYLKLYFESFVDKTFKKLPDKVYEAI